MSGARATVTVNISAEGERERVRVPVRKVAPDHRGPGRRHNSRFAIAVQPAAYRNLILTDRSLVTRKSLRQVIENDPSRTSPW